MRRDFDGVVAYCSFYIVYMDTKDTLIANNAKWLNKIKIDKREQDMNSNR